jgi:D-lyxose ketol-isomerase
MDELDKGLEISVQGEVRSTALARFRRQIETWHVALPPVEPLVLDFGLGRFQDTGLIEYWISNETEWGYCAKYLFVFDGQTCPEHRHRTKHETFFVVKGAVALSLGETTLELNAGDVYPVPPGERHSFTGSGPALLLEISKPCVIADNYFSNPDIPIGG